MDPMSFENGLKPRLDLFGNAQNSPFFSKLPGELRNAIYANILTQPLFLKDCRRRLLSPFTLIARRPLYTDAVEYVDSFIEHKITIELDLAIFRTAPRIPLQFILTRNIAGAATTRGQSSAISTDDITSAERHLRGIILYLSSNGAILESLKVVVHKGYKLNPEAAFEPLDGLREIRVDGRVRALGMEECRLREIYKLIESIKDAMMAPDIVDGDGRSQVTIASMCQHLWDVLYLWIEYVEDWPEDSATDYEKMATLDHLRNSFEAKYKPRGENKPMEEFRATFWSVEAIYAKIDRKGFGEFQEAATSARERLYIRKAF
ncbi:hypothetical protein MMC22_005063 [Lobaria immixta]|nr:hypothetical protein [Lobaria immixta]